LLFSLGNPADIAAEGSRVIEGGCQRSSSMALPNFCFCIALYTLQTLRDAQFILF